MVPGLGTCVSEHLVNIWLSERRVVDNSLSRVEKIGCGQRVSVVASASYATCRAPDVGPHVCPPMGCPMISIPVRVSHSEKRRSLRQTLWFLVSGVPRRYRRQCIAGSWEPGLRVCVPSRGNYSPGKRGKAQFKMGMESALVPIECQ